MTFATGNVASNVSSAQLFCQAIDVTLTAEPGITKVDAAVVAGTLTWNIYKSAAGTNSIGIDFYFGFGYPTTGANSVCMTMFEGYNNSTHQATNYAPRASGVTPAANFANPTGASSLPSTGANLAYIQTANIPSNFSYAYSDNANRVHWEIFSTTGPVNESMSMGIRDTPLPSTYDPVPIYCIHTGIVPAIGSTLTNLPTAVAGFHTREPNTITSQNLNFTCGFGSSLSFNYSLATSISSPDIYTNQPYVTRTPIQGRTNNQSFLGLPKDIYLATTQTNNGDQLQFILNGTTYTGTRMTTAGIYFLNN